jgi:ankyrin repeat protein
VVESGLSYNAGMENRVVRSVVLLSVLAVSAVGFSSGGQAQGVGMMDPSQALSRRAQQTPDLTKQAAPAPPALPGASSRADTVAPATRLPTDMSPNDALFDAINRGDIAAARDALSRGADLSAQNLLGMTPMELSVDLGRNDISFLLLSYRGDTSSGATAATAQDQTASPAKPTKAAGAKAAKNEKVVPVKAIAPVAPQTPRLFANDGGTPVPNAGFLGFGTAR